MWSQHTSLKHLILLCLLTAMATATRAAADITVLPYLANFESSIAPFDNGDVASSNSNIGNVFHLKSNASNQMATATASLANKNKLASTETVTIDFTAYHGWLSNSRNSTVAVCDADGEELISYTYDHNSTKVTSVRLGGAIAPDFAAFDGASFYETGRNANGLDIKGKPYKKNETTGQYNPYILMTLRGDGQLTFSFWITQKGIYRSYSTKVAGGISIGSIQVSTNCENADRSICIDDLSITRRLFVNDYEQSGAVPDWTSRVSGRYTPIIREDASTGNHYLTVNQDERDERYNNGSTLTSPSMNVAAGTNYYLSFKLRLCKGDNQPSAFYVKDAKSKDILWLTALISDKKSDDWILYSETETDGKKDTISFNVTLPESKSSNGTKDENELPWYQFTIIQIGDNTHATITSEDETTKFAELQITNSEVGGLSRLEFVTKRYNAQFSIDNVVLQRLGWDNNGADVNVELTDVDEDNRVSKGMPTFYNTFADTPTFSYGGVLPNLDTTYPPRMNKTGTGTVTATISEQAQSFNVNITSAPTGGGTYDNSTKTFTFDQIGTLSAYYSVTEVPGIRMTLGKTGSETADGSPTAIVVNDPVAGCVLKAIDANGYSHPNLDYGRAGGLIPAAGRNGGTYYVFEPQSNGTLTVHGHLSNATLYEFKGSSATYITGDNNGTVHTANLTGGSIYYLYNGKLNDQNNPTPLLHAFSYQPRQQIKFSAKNVNGHWDSYPSDTAIVVSKDEDDFTNAVYTDVTAESDQRSTISYSSSDPEVATVDNDGKVTMLKSGVTIITATAAANGTYPETSKSYRLEINVLRSWVFDKDLCANLTTTSGDWATKSTYDKDQLVKSTDGKVLDEAKDLLFTSPLGNGGRLSINWGHSIQMNQQVSMQIPASQFTANGQVIEVVVDTHGSNDMQLTNASFLTTREPATSIHHPTGGCQYVMDRRSDSLTITCGGNGWMRVRAIYIYKPGKEVSGTMQYNGGLPMTVSGEALPHDISISEGLFGSLYDFSSSNESMVRLSDTTTGLVSAVANGEATVSSYARSLDPFNYCDARVTATVSVSAAGNTASKLIDVSELMYQPMENSADGGLDREIPYFLLTMTGGNNVMSSADGTQLLLKNDGTITVSPRYQTGHTNNITITHAVLYFSNGRATAIEPGSASESIAITNKNGNVTHIMVEYQCGITPDSQLDSSPFQPTFSYANTTPEVEQGSTFAVMEPTTSPKNLRDIVYSLTGTNGVDWIYQDNTLTTINTGEYTLQATFAATRYFKAVSTPASCVITVKEPGENNYVSTLDIKEKLAIEPHSNIDGFAFINEKLTPLVTLTSADGIDSYLGDYRISYESSNKGVAYIDGETIVTGPVQGITTITASFEPKSGSGVIFSRAFRLMVLNELWDFRTYTQTNGHNLLDWSVNNKSRLRDTEDFEYIITTSGQPLDCAAGLSSRYKMRMTYSNTYGNLHLFGNGTALYGQGGILRVPTRPGMVVQLYASSSAQQSTMDVDGLDELDGTPAEHFTVNEMSELFTFLAAGDHFDIINPSTNLNLYLHYIQLSTDMVFKYGNETFAETNQEDFNNPVLNRGESKLAYEIRNGDTSKTAPWVADDKTMCDEDYVQHIHTGVANGIINVHVTGSGGGILDGRSGDYTVYVINMSVQDTKEVTINVEGTMTHADLTDLITIEADVVTPVISVEKMKERIVFSIESSNTEATLNGRSLTINGAGTVIIKATLGAITKTITYHVRGAALQNPSDVIYSNVKEYTIRTLQTPAAIKTGIVFDIERMKAGIMGDLKGKAITLTETTIESTPACKVTLPGDGTGGVIPIYASYVDINNITHQLEGTLTVAYKSHTWDFSHNMIDELGNWYVDLEKTQKQGKWTDDATFDMPTEWDDALTYGHPNHHNDDHDWKFVRKIGGNHREASIIYYYNHTVSGTNALVIPETQGLTIKSSKSDRQLGVQMNSTRVIRDAYTDNPWEWGQADTYSNGDDKRQTSGLTVTFGGQERERSYESAFLTDPTDPTSYHYYVADLMVLRGGQVVVPKVKPGQWIEVRWTRHTDDQAERLTMENLADINGKYISEVYKIGNCYWGQNTSSYMFQVPPADDSHLTLDEDGCVDAKFTVADNVYISIQQIILHEPGWDFHTSINTSLKQVIDGVSTDVANQYLSDGTERKIALANRLLQNAPNAPSIWDIQLDETLIEAKKFDSGTGSGLDDAWFSYKDGWGKAVITLTSYTQNMKYVANRKTWVVTIGRQPAQHYPYTWDFTKYFANTEDKTGNTSKYFINYNLLTTDGDLAPMQVNMASWTVGAGADRHLKTSITKGYNTSVYPSYFVDGAQLVSYGLRSELPETQGLGFRLNNVDQQLNATAENAATAQLTLDMAATVADGVGERADNEGHTWSSGKLTISSQGGSIIVPKPGDAATSFYLYVRSTPKPAVDGDVLQEVDTRNELGSNQYCFRFKANRDAVLTFASGADVYAIGVTDMFKQLTPVEQTATTPAAAYTAWATESRDRTIDYALTGYLTTNMPQAYVIISKDGNPVYTDDHRAIISIEDQRYVVPAETGLVMKQASVTTGAVYDVPLFVPAVTTREDAASDLANNLLRPNVTEQMLTSENESMGSEDYVRFILAKRYMTWKKDGEAGGSGTVTTPDRFETRPTVAAAFYRLHLYGSNPANLKDENNVALTGTTEQMNTLGANKAYLLLPYSKVGDPLWDFMSPSRRFVPIKGVSDMAYDYLPAETLPATGTYNLKGQQVDDSLRLRPGLYIKEGRKVIVR